MNDSPRQDIGNSLELPAAWAVVGGFRLAGGSEGSGYFSHWLEAFVFSAGLGFSSTVEPHGRSLLILGNGGWVQQWSVPGGSGLET